jgi:hypothetical protein
MDFARIQNELEVAIEDLHYGDWSSAMDRLRTLRVEEVPKHFTIRSIANTKKKIKRPPSPQEIQFKSILKGWKEHTETGGEGSPEALAGFLRRHLGGDPNWDHEKIANVARGMGADEAMADRTADHYESLGGSNEAVKTKLRWLRRRY